MNTGICLIPNPTLGPSKSGLSTQMDSTFPGSQVFHITDFLSFF